MEKTYEMNEDYILEVLEDEEDRLTEKILLDGRIPEQIKFTIKKLLAVKNEIEKINAQTAFEKECTITSSNLNC